MQIRLKMSPVVVVGPTKEILNRKIHDRFRVTCFSYNSYGSGLKCGFRNDTFLMVNYQKFRSKRGKREAHWVAYVYKFEEDFLKGTDLRVKQNTRNFELYHKK